MLGLREDMRDCGHWFAVTLKAESVLGPSEETNENLKVMRPSI